MPTISIGAREWRAAMIALASLFAVSILLLALQTDGLLNNSLLEHLAPRSIAHFHTGAPDRVSLDIHSWSPTIDPTSRYSVAHPLPANVASSQRFSIGGDERVAFDVFGETALSGMLADERTVSQLKPHNDRLMMMLMLMQLHQHRD